MSGRFSSQMIFNSVLRKFRWNLLRSLTWRMWTVHVSQAYSGEDNKVEKCDNVQSCCLSITFSRATTLVAYDAFCGYNAIQNIYKAI